VNQQGIKAEATTTATKSSNNNSSSNDDTIDNLNNIKKELISININNAMAQ